MRGWQPRARPLRPPAPSQSAETSFCLDLESEETISYNVLGYLEQLGEEYLKKNTE